jgi:hypothetical protein
VAQKEMLRKIKILLEYAVALLIITDLIWVIVSFAFKGNSEDRFGIARYTRQYPQLFLYIAVLAVFIVLLLFFISYAEKWKRQIGKHVKSEEVFRVLAQQNAVYDKLIFHRLFVDLHGSTAVGRKYLIDQAVRETVTNVRDMLNKIEEIFTGITGNRCASCVQVIERLEVLMSKRR